MDFSSLAANKAASGAMLGTQIAPGVGTLIGAGAGALGGLFQASAARRAQRRKEELERAQGALKIEMERDQLQKSILNNMGSTIDQLFGGV